MWPTMNPFSRAQMDPQRFSQHRNRIRRELMFSATAGILVTAFIWLLDASHSGGQITGLLLTPGFTLASLAKPLYSGDGQFYFAGWLLSLPIYASVVFLLFRITHLVRNSSVS